MQRKACPALFHSCDPQDAGSAQKSWRSPIPRLFQHCRYQRHKMILCGRSVYHNVETMVKHFAHFAGGTSVLESPAAEIFHLPKQAMSLLNSKTFILMNFSVFLLKLWFGALRKSLFSSFFPAGLNSVGNKFPSASETIWKTDWWLTLGLLRAKVLYSLKVALFPFAGKLCPYKNRLEALVFSVCENTLTVQLLAWTLKWCKSA